MHKWTRFRKTNHISISIIENPKFDKNTNGLKINTIESGPNINSTIKVDILFTEIHILARCARAWYSNSSSSSPGRENPGGPGGWGRGSGAQASGGPAACAPFHSTPSISDGPFNSEDALMSRQATLQEICRIDIARHMSGQLNTPAYSCLFSCSECEGFKSEALCERCRFRTNRNRRVKLFLINMFGNIPRLCPLSLLKQSN